MTKKQTNKLEEELNGKEMPFVSTFKIQDLINEAVSQEKEKWIGNKPEQIVSYLEEVFKSNYLQITSEGGEERREYVKKTLLNLLQNK